MESFSRSGVVRDGQNNDNVDVDTGCPSSAAVSASTSSQVQHGSPASSVRCPGCGASVFIPAGNTSSFHSQPVLPSTDLPGGFKLTAEEFQLLDDGLERELWHKSGKIQWDRVEVAFASKADNRFIFKRSTSRLQSTYQNYPTAKKSRLKYVHDNDMTDAAAASSLPLVSSSDETIPSQLPRSCTDVTMSAHPPASSQPSHASSSSLAISSSSSSSSNSSVFVQVKKTKSEQPFSDDEKRMIKKWGFEKVGQVTRAFLYQKHFDHFHHTLGYARNGEEMVQFWKNSEDRKRKDKMH